MKVLRFSESLEKDMIYILDAALKSGGLQAVESVQRLRMAVQEEKQEKEE